MPIMWTQGLGTNTSPPTSLLPGSHQPARIFGLHPKKEHDPGASATSHLNPDKECVMVWMLPNTARLRTSRRWQL